MFSPYLQAGVVRCMKNLENWRAVILKLDSSKYRKRVAINNNILLVLKRVIHNVVINSGVGLRGCGDQSKAGNVTISICQALRKSKGGWYTTGWVEGVG